MKTPRLFWHLVKFHVLSVPWYLWAGVLGMVVLLGGAFMQVGSTTRLSSGDNMVSLIYFFILAAQASWGMGKGTNVPAAQSWATGSQDFLRTRAIDRGILFWSKLLIFSTICSLVWVTLSAPNLLPARPVQVTLFGGPGDAKFQSAVLGTPSLRARVVSESPGKKCVVELGGGAMALAGLGGVKVAGVSLLILWFVVALRLHYGWLIGIFFGSLALWLSVLLGSLWLKHETWLDAIEYRNQVLFYARHPLWVWTFLAAFGAMVIGHAYRRYLRV